MPPNVQLRAHSTLIFDQRSRVVFYFDRMNKSGQESCHPDGSPEQIVEQVDAMTTVIKEWAPSRS